MLKERIDATEALITIHLDSRRNDLVAFDLVGFSSPCKRPAFRRGDLEGCCLLLELSFTLLLYNRGSADEIHGVNIFSLIAED